MNELVKIIEYDSRRLVDARDLHKRLGVKSRFNDWINNRIKNYAYVEGEDFFLEAKKQSDSRICDYLITMDVAKELAIVENNEKGREIRRYLISSAEAWNTPEKVIARAKQAGAIILTEKEVEEFEFLAEGMAVTPFPECSLKGLPANVWRIWTSNEEGGRVYMLQSKESKLTRWIHIYDANGKHIRIFMTRWSDRYNQWMDYDSIQRLQKEYLSTLGTWGKRERVQFTDYFRWRASMIKAGKINLQVEDKRDKAVEEISAPKAGSAAPENVLPFEPPKRKRNFYRDEVTGERVFYDDEEASAAT